MKRTCVIFDFDGVIADTDLARFQILKIILKRYEITLTDLFYSKLIGYSTKAFLKKNFSQLSEKVIDEIITERHNIYFDNLSKYCIPFKGMKETIGNLTEIFDLAIVTTNNHDIVSKQLKHLEIINHFNWIIGREFAEDKSLNKTYSKVSKIIGKLPTESIVVEDSLVGITAAESEGYLCIKFDPNSRKKDSSDYIVTDYYELRQMILNLSNE